MRMVVALLIAVLAVGCVEGGEPARRHRWPDHRQSHDAQLEDLQKRVATLEKELTEMRAYVARLHVKQAPVEPSEPTGPLPTTASPPPPPAPSPPNEPN